MRVTAFSLLLLAVLLSACQRPPAQAAAPELPPREVLAGYRQLAHAATRDAHERARDLLAAVQQLIASPGEDTLDAARKVWVSAREPYSFAEALRFGNWFVDEADERINPWPVDEGFLDYVQALYAGSPSNQDGQLNLVAAPDRVMIGGRWLETEPLQRITLKMAQELSNSESNLTTGYHAIEFLLWGQDLSDTGPGERPWTDYALTAEHCTDGHRTAALRHCRRRAALLLSASEILVQDLEILSGQWSDLPGSFGDRLVTGDIASGLRRMLFGLAAMSAEELAGERLEIGLLTGSQEEELDCFSDTTHRSLYANALGIAGLYRGHYREQKRPSLAAWLQAHHPDLAARIEHEMDLTLASMARIRALGEAGETFDRLIHPEHPHQGEDLRRAITALRNLGAELEAVGERLELGLLNPRGRE